VTPTRSQTEDLDNLKLAFSGVASTIEELCPEGRYQALALTYLEIASMLASKAVTHS
jgi:hypothetical protein